MPVMQVSAEYFARRLLTQIRQQVYATTTRAYTSSSRDWCVYHHHYPTGTEHGGQTTSAAKEYLVARGVNPVVK
jgi:hypothetical protein